MPAKVEMLCEVKNNKSRNIEKNVIPLLRDYIALDLTDTVVQLYRDNEENEEAFYLCVDGHQFNRNMKVSNSFHFSV